MITSLYMLIALLIAVPCGLIAALPRRYGFAVAFLLVGVVAYLWLDHATGEQEGDFANFLVEPVLVSVLAGVVAGLVLAYKLSRIRSRISR